MDRISYIANSRASLEALKSANLLKSLNINAIIIGECGTGKETLAKFILPKAEVVDGNSFQEVLSQISKSNCLIIKNFDKISNIQMLQSAITDHQTRVLATSRTEFLEKTSSEFFSLKITLPPLSQREEDIEPLVNKFFKEILSIFGTDGDNLSLKDFKPDLSRNCHSLRKSVYVKYLMSSFKEEDIMRAMEEFLLKRLGGKNDYRDQLYLFDVPMIRCGFKKFNSQLGMSEKFGLNRNTLRKKINDYKDKYKLQ